MNNAIKNPIKSEFKIVITGNVGAGKTTLIHAMSEIPVIGTEAKTAKANPLHRKSTTTTAMEYGVAQLGSAKLHLYGTPGQRRFDFMADILCRGASAMLVVIDHSCLHPLQEVDYYLNQHRQFLHKNPGVIAFTHCDSPSGEPALLEYHRYIVERGLVCPVLKLDARKKPDIEKALQKLLSQMAHYKDELSVDFLQLNSLAA